LDVGRWAFGVSSVASLALILLRMRFFEPVLVTVFERQIPMAFSKSAALLSTPPRASSRLDFFFTGWQFDCWRR
jgi:hypothetical protein